MIILKRSIIVLLGLSVAACSSVPTAIIHQPNQVLSSAAKPMKEQNGAIFNAGSYRPMFEDVRARLVGDIITITISENTSATKSGANSASKSGSVAFATPTLFGLPSTSAAQGSLSTSTSNKFDEKGAASASNSFSGTITVTVVEVLPNGNLLVSGEKQIALDKAAEFVRFSGVVNPATILSGNTVSSAKVADARFEYRSTARVDKAELNSMLSRFFLSFLPL